MLAVRCVSLLWAALLVIGIISLLIRVAEALLAVALLLAAVLLVAALLITVWLVTILLVTAVACPIAILLLIAAAVFQAVIECRIGDFHIRSDIKPREAASNASQEKPENERKIQYELIHLEIGRAHV